MKNKILVVSVHPDDETLGCGGTLLKYKDNGHEIHWLICTTIDKTDNYFETREKEIDEVSRMYNFDSVNNLRLKTTLLDEYKMSDLINRISEVFNEIKPNIVYLPFNSDVHSDHRKIFEASYSCTKSFRNPYLKKIYMMETLSETEFAPSLKENSFMPNVFCDITDYINKKIEIMKIYKSELSDHPFPRSIKNIQSLAMFRGASSGCEYAESFILLKEII